MRTLLPALLALIWRHHVMLRRGPTRGLTA